MERALNIPETLIAIFTFLRDAEDIVNAACVCHRWHGCAVDTIWMNNDVPIKIVIGLLGSYTEISDELVVGEAAPMGAEGDAEAVAEAGGVDAEIPAAHPTADEADTPAAAEDDEDGEDDEDDEDDEDEDGDESTDDKESLDLSPRCLQLDAPFESLSASTIDGFLRRSRQLTRLSLERYSLHEDTIDTLRRISLDAGSVFPNVQHTRMYPTHGMFLNTLLAVLGPMVSSLGVTTEADNVLEDALTAALAKSSPITDISTTSPVFISPSHISHFTGLKYLLWWGTAAFSYKSWRALAASCPDLRSLEMHLGSKTLDALQDREDKEEIVFPSLEILHLDDSSETGCMPGAILASRFPSLKSISVDQAQLLDADVHRIIDHVKKGSPHLVIVWVYFWEETRISLQTLRSISWPSLTTLSCDSRAGWEIADGDLEQLVRGLPQLEILDLSTNQVWPPEVEFKSDLTVLSLIPLARYCKKLQQLFLTLKLCDLNQRDDAPVLAALTMLSLPIHVLGVDDDLGPTAAFLARMCPKVEDPYIDVYIPGGIKSAEFTNMFRAERKLVEEAVIVPLLSQAQ